MANKSCNYWKIQIHWNKFEWVNPISLIERNTNFCVSTKNFYLKDNDKTSHWVGHSRLKPLDLEDFYNSKRIINEL